MRMPLAAIALAACSGPEISLGTRDDRPTPVDPPAEIDLDGDSFSVAEGDCDDHDPLRGPDAYFEDSRDIDCDGIDNDCTGVVDQDALGVRACAKQDRFVQTMKTDVLFVVDQTVPMSAHWSKAVAGANVLAGHVSGPGADSHIGVISTDMSDPKKYNGRLLAPEGAMALWLEGSLPWSDAIRERFFEGAIASRTPQGPGSDEGARAALNASIVVEGDAYNDGFMRVEAPLNVVFLTFDEDTSEPDNTGLFEMLATYRTNGNTVFYALTQTGDFGCDGQRTAPASTLISLVQTTGGFYESLCLDDYEGFMSSVGQAIATDALQSTFKLEHAALLTSVSVLTQVEGEDAIPWNGTFALTDPWTIVFPDAAPPAGSTIIVDYERDWRF